VSQPPSDTGRPDPADRDDGAHLKRSLDTGDSVQRCMDIGRVTMLLKLGTRFPELRQITDQRALTTRTCEAIALSLRDLGGGSALVARR